MSRRSSKRYEEDSHSSDSDSEDSRSSYSSSSSSSSSNDKKKKRKRNRSRDSSRSDSRSNERKRRDKRPQSPRQEESAEDVERMRKKIAELEKLGVGGRAGGVYIPPNKLALLQKEAESLDKNTQEYQKLHWESLRKKINGLINKVNIANIKDIVFDVFKINIIRGRGLLCRSLLKSQAASPGFTPVYAALVAIINSKIPDIGRLLVDRLINIFKKSFRRNDKKNLLSSTKFIDRKSVV